jgi:hypothetical protein
MTKKKNRYELGVCFQKEDVVGRTVSHVSIREKDGSAFGGFYLCSLQFVGRELKEAVGITKNILLNALNKSKIDIKPSQIEESLKTKK